MDLQEALMSVKYGDKGSTARRREGIIEHVIQQTTQGGIVALVYCGETIREFRFSYLPKTGWILN